jgi:ribosomal protein S18 acetylase RimI-like enzyme
MTLRFPKKAFLQSKKKHGLVLERKNYEFSLFSEKTGKIKKKRLLGILEINPIVSISKHGGIKKLTLTIQFIGLTKLALRAKLARSGIASNLLKFVEEEARLHGIKRIDALVDEENGSAISFFIKHGFKKAGIIGGGHRIGETETFIFFKDLNP